MLDRLRSVRLLEPLARRDFALLTGAATISLLGDGFFFIALAWQVYELSNVPTAMSLVGVAWTLPLVLFLLLGGVLTDRYDRRRLLIGADLLRAVVIGLVGVLSIVGALELWHVIVLIAFVGVGDAFFNPASTAIVPDLVPERLLPQANAVQGLVRPLMMRLIGPAIGGFVVAGVGSGPAFVVDAATFLASAAAVLAIAARPMPGERPRAGLRQALVEVRQGFGFVRRNAWCWATLVAGMLSLLVFYGPMQVLLPYLVKNRLDLGPEALGTIFAVSGIGSILAALLIGQTGLPRLRVTVMYAAFALGVLPFAIYGVMTELWMGMAAGFATAALFQLGQITWNTMLQELVPRDLLGRVSSLDWLVSTALVPVSFALTAPVAGIIGPADTMIGAGVVGAVLMGALLFVPGVRDPERGRLRVLTAEADAVAIPAETPHVGSV
jgi:DHA3 family tetracycline resistance protein-like MFS transporter